MLRVEFTKNYVNLQSRTAISRFVISLGISTKDLIQATAEAITSQVLPDDLVTERWEVELGSA